MSLKNTAQETLDILELDIPCFLGCFDRVVFAVYTSNQNLDTLTAFQTRF